LGSNNDFTEENYRLILGLAKKHYSFITYPEYNKPGRNTLWRHDIDLSVHRAYRLAQIEHEEAVISTFFIHLHNDFYNALELDIVKIVRKIIDLGHTIGLHFDTSFYADSLDSADRLEYYLQKEAELIRSLFNTDCQVFSFHNPYINNCLNIDKLYLAGMINTYAEFIRDNYAYCSDSNGQWHHERLPDILKDARYDKLQVLTHPGWWTPESMPPRQRVSRSIDGRAANQHRRYDELFSKLKTDQAMLTSL